MALRPTLGEFDHLDDNNYFKKGVLYIIYERKDNSMRAYKSLDCGCLVSRDGGGGLIQCFTKECKAEAHFKEEKKRDFVKKDEDFITLTNFVDNIKHQASRLSSIVEVLCEYHYITEVIAVINSTRSYIKDLSEYVDKFENDNKERLKESK